MKCPYCETNVGKSDRICPGCGRPIDEKARRRAERSPARKAAGVAMAVFFVLVSLTFFSLLFYRAYFWLDAWRASRVYERGDMMEPLVEEIEMSDGSVGHAITFFGSDGDTVFIKELRKSFLIAGGLTRIEIEDASWFGETPEDVEYANVTLTPILYQEGGGQRALPDLTMKIMTPESPLKLINPSGDYLKVNTSVFPLEFQVVPGSTVLVGGEDVTDTVNYLGEVSVNINIYPQGDNPISLLVTTKNHRQTRREIDLYREYQEINLEPSLNLPKSSNRSVVTITGSVDPTANFSVDTAHEEGSVKVEPSGSFSFKAKMEVIGDNKITFRATKDGKQDSVVSVTVYYVPTLNEYSRKAWKMDYDQLKLLYEQWNGRVFLCDGTIVENFVEDGKNLIAMNVGTDDKKQIVVMDNMSNVGTPAVGERYKAWADVSGLIYYDKENCPRLVCRYMNAVTPEQAAG